MASGKMRAQPQQSGFTLIELVVVIVILGILVAVALPKFMGLSTDARLSVMNGTAGSVSEAADLVHALAEVNDQIASSGSVTLPDGTVVATTFGYPDASTNGIPQALQGYTGTPTVSFPFSFEPTTTAGLFFYTPPGGNGANNGCVVTYTPPTTTGGSPAVTMTTSGC